MFPEKDVFSKEGMFRKGDIAQKEGADGIQKIRQ